MARHERFTESFDLETLDQFSSSTAAAVISSSMGGGDFAVELSATTGALSKTFSAGAAALFWGFFAGFDNTNDATKRIIVWKKGSTVLGSLRFNSGNRKVEAYTGTGTLVATSNFVWNDLADANVQLRVVLDNSAGVIQVKINNTLEIDFSGDTQPGADTDIDGFEFTANTGKSRYASILVNNTTGSVDNGWPNVVRMRGRKPDADGADNDFDRDPASPTTAYTHLDEAGAPDSGDLVSSDVNGARQSLRFPSHGLIRATPLAVNYFYHMRKLSSGEGQHGLRRISDSNEQMDAAPRALSTSFRTEVFHYPVNPVTGLPFTLDEAQEDEYESVMEAVT